jgi:endoglucanase
MYRLYNNRSGEHFYTASEAEKKNLVNLGWRDEGIGWVAPEKSNHPVYRLYNKSPLCQ